MSEQNNKISEPGYAPRNSIGVDALNTSRTSINPVEGFKKIVEIGQGLRNVNKQLSDYQVHQIQQDTADKQRQIQVNNYNIDNALKNYQNDVQNRLQTAEQKADGTAISQIYDEVKGHDGIQNLTNYVKQSNFDGKNGDSGYLNNKDIQSKLENFNNIDLGNRVRNARDKFVGGQYSLGMQEQTNGLSQKIPNIRDDDWDKEKNNLMLGVWAKDINSGVAPLGLNGLQDAAGKASFLDEQRVRYEIERNPYKLLPRLKDGMQDYEGDAVRPTGKYNQYYKDLKNLPYWITTVENHIKQLEKKKKVAPDGFLNQPVANKIANGDLKTPEQISTAQQIREQNEAYPYESAAKSFAKDDNFKRLSQPEQNEKIVQRQIGASLTVSPMSNSDLQNIDSLTNATISAQDMMQGANAILGNVGDTGKSYLLNLGNKPIKPVTAKIDKYETTIYTNGMPKKPNATYGLDLLARGQNDLALKQFDIQSQINQQQIPINDKGLIDVKQLKDTGNKKNDIYVKRDNEYENKIVPKVNSRHTFLQKYDPTRLQAEKKSLYNSYILSGKDYTDDFKENHDYIMNGKIEAALPKEISKDFQNQANDIMQYADHYVSIADESQKQMGMRNIRREAKFVPAQDPKFQVEGADQTYIMVMPNRGKQIALMSKRDDIIKYGNDDSYSETPLKGKYGYVTIGIFSNPDGTSYYQTSKPVDDKALSDEKDKMALLFLDDN